MGKRGSYTIQGNEFILILPTCLKDKLGVTSNDFDVSIHRNYILSQCWNCALSIYPSIRFIHLTRTQSVRIAYDTIHVAIVP